MFGVFLYKEQKLNEILYLVNITDEQLELFKQSSRHFKKVRFEYETMLFVIHFYYCRYYCFSCSLNLSPPSFWIIRSTNKFNSSACTSKSMAKRKLRKDPSSHSTVRHLMQLMEGDCRRPNREITIELALWNGCQTSVGPLSQGHWNVGWVDEMSFTQPRFQWPCERGPTLVWDPFP